MTNRSLHVLLCWEAGEENSWTPVLARRLRERGHRVDELHDLDGLDHIDLGSVDVCLPRFRTGAANMTCLDEVLAESGIPMVNSARCRRLCEDKGLAHLAFARAGIRQPPSLVLSREGEADRTADWRGETLIKPLHGCRGSGIEILPSLRAAVARARDREEDLLVQAMVWPARSWRVIVGRTCGAVDPYWRRPAASEVRVASVSTGARIVRDPLAPAGRELAERMLGAVQGHLLAADLLETRGGLLALEINHNFDAHGGTEPAVDAFEREMRLAAFTGADAGRPLATATPGGA